MYFSWVPVYYAGRLLTGGAVVDVLTRSVGASPEANAQNNYTNTERTQSTECP